MTTATPTKKGLFQRTPKPYVHPYFGGMVLGIVLFLALFLTGNGLGSPGATSRIVTAADGFDVVTRFFEVIAKQRRERLFVLGDQNAWLHSKRTVHCARPNFTLKLSGRYPSSTTGSPRTR